MFITSSINGAHVFYSLFIIFFLGQCQPPYNKEVTQLRPFLGATVIQFKEPVETEQIALAPGLQVPAEAPGYTLILPEGEVNGVVLAFHSGRDTSHPGYEMRLYTEALRRNIATVYITTGNPFDFLFDSTGFRKYSRYLSQLLNDHGLVDKPFLYVGMSLAGTRALKYALFCLSKSGSCPLKPYAVAVCDAPLDFTRFYWDEKRALDRNLNPISVNEANWVTYQLETHLGGDPEMHPEAYKMYSLFTYGPPGGANASYFKDLPIRVYTEPDVQWWIENRQKDYYSMNALDAAAFINELRLLGNKRAELVTTTGKGHHPDGTRHPHSWSIVDNRELIEWFLSIVE
jgi:hypothetical protein